jgi:general secretion pathway protein A
MFLDFYNLKEQPFPETPAPRHLYLSATHREALASLYYGIETGRGFLALIAEPGMGKTTLLFHLLEGLKGSARTAFLFQTQCNARGFLRCLLSDLGIEAEGMNLGSMHEQLKVVLIREANAGRRVLVFIDEAQNLRDSTLETIRLLSNFETTRSKLMQIVLAGQPQLAEKLARPNLVQLRQRVSIVSQLRPLTSTETNAYINHRLWLAGCHGRRLFTPGAHEIIAARSNGVPRNINNICFNALTLGYAMGLKQIDRSVVQEVLIDLELDKLVAQKRGPSVSVPSASPVCRKASSLFFWQQWDVGGAVRRMLSLATALLLLASASSMTGTGRVSRTVETHPLKVRSFAAPESSLSRTDSSCPGTEESPSIQVQQLLGIHSVRTNSGSHKACDVGKNPNRVVSSPAALSVSP